jgi:molybdopterin converting factor small subunit
MTKNEIILELTGPLERAAGCSEVRILSESAQTLSSVLMCLLTDYPQTKNVLGESSRYIVTEGELPPGLLVIRDSVALQARLETRVEPGDRLTLMPMISGG